MKTVAAVLGLQLAALGQIVGAPVGTGRPMLQFGNPTSGGFCTSITPNAGTSAAWCAQALALAPTPVTIPGLSGFLYLGPILAVEPALASGSGVEWLHVRPLPTSVPTLGLTLCTQFLLLTPAGFELSQGWTTPLT